jgi:hypothetical protein
VIGFAYVAYNANDVVGTDPAPTGSLSIPFNDMAANGLTFTDHDAVDTVAAPLTPDIATIGQCRAVTSIDVPMRYAAFGSNVPSHAVGLEEGPDMSTSGGFMVDVVGKEDEEPKGFTGYANVLAGTYEYVLTASDGSDPRVDSKDRRWDLHVTAALMPGDNDNDPRSGATLHDGEGPEESAATAGDWANFVPAGFMVPASATNPGFDAATAPALVDNVPRLSLPGTQAAPAGVTLGGEINSATDVDVFWLGSLAPNWKLELKVIGTSTVDESEDTGGIGDHNEVTLELHQHGGDMVALDAATTDASYDWEVAPDAVDGGLTCANYYIKVSGQEGRYTLAWKLSHPE